MRRDPMKLVFGALIVVVLIGLAGFFLSGCGALGGLLDSESFDLQHGRVSAANDGINKATALAIDGDKLTAADGRYVLGITDRASVGLDLAQEAHDAGDVETAEGRLRLADRIFEEIETYLLTKGVKTDGDE